MAQPTQTGIVNAALARLGSTDRLTSIESGGSNSAYRAAVLWDDVRRALLARHPWNFAIARKRLNAASPPPQFGYARRFKLPVDCLRWLPPGDRADRDWFEGEVEGGFILSNAAAPLPCRYIRDHDTVSEWPPMFVQAMTICLADWMCEGITQSVGINDRLIELADNAIRLAKRIDGLETGRKRAGGVVVRSEWLGSRRRSYPGAR